MTLLGKGTLTKIVVDLLQYTGKKGGIEAYVRELYRAIGNLQLDIELIGFASSELYSSGKNSWFPGEIVDSGISGENRLSWAFGELFSVSRFAKKVKADLIHAPAMLGPLSSSIPTVLTIHDLSYFTHPELMKTKWLTTGVKWMERVAARNATRIIAISEATADQIEIFLKNDFSKVDVILSAGRQLGHANSNQSNRQSDLFVSAGQRSPYKSLETVIEAWAVMPSDRRPRLIVTGSHGEDPLKGLVEKHELQDSVQLLGWISDTELNELMENCTAFIETTRAAGFGMPALESMSIGTPVIISDIPVFREVVGDSADFYTAGSANELADVVLRFVQNPERQLQLQQEGPLWAAKYNWELTAQTTVACFENALRRVIQTRASG